MALNSGWSDDPPPTFEAALMDAESHNEELYKGKAEIVQRALNPETAGELSESLRLSRQTSVINDLIPHSPTLALFDHGANVIMAMIDLAPDYELRQLGEAFFVSWKLAEPLMNRAERTRKSDLASNILNTVPFHFWSTNSNSLIVLKECIPLVDDRTRTLMMNSPSLLTFTETWDGWAVISAIIDCSEDCKNQVMTIIDPLLSSMISKGGVKMQLLINLILKGSNQLSEILLNAGLLYEGPNQTEFAIFLLKGGSESIKSRVIKCVCFWPVEMQSNLVDCMINGCSMETRTWVASRFYAHSVKNRIGQVRELCEKLTGSNNLDVFPLHQREIELIHIEDDDSNSMRVHLTQSVQPTTVLQGDQRSIERRDDSLPPAAKRLRLVDDPSDTVVSREEKPAQEVVVVEDSDNESKNGRERGEEVESSEDALPELGEPPEEIIKDTVAAEDRLKYFPSPMSTPSTVILPYSIANSSVAIVDPEKESTAEVTVVRPVIDRGDDVTTMAMNEKGASKIISGLKRMSVEDRSIVFKCIQDSLLQLAKHTNGHRVVQWFISNGTADQLSHLSSLITANLVSLVQCGGYGRSTVNCLIDNCLDTEKKGELNEEFQRVISSPSDDGTREIKKEVKEEEESDDEIEVIRCVPAPKKTVVAPARSRALSTPCLRPVDPSLMLDQTEFMQRLQSIISTGCKLKDILFVIGALSKGIVKDSEEVLSWICEASSSLCIQSEHGLKLILAVVQKYPACCVDIGIKIGPIRDQITQKEQGRMIVRQILKQKTGMSFANSSFNGGLSSPFFSLLNGEDSVRELVDDIFDAASREIKLSFVSEYRQEILKTRHGHSFIRGLMKSGIISEMILDEEGREDGGTVLNEHLASQEEILRYPSTSVIPSFVLSNPIFEVYRNLSPSEAASDEDQFRSVVSNLVAATVQICRKAGGKERIEKKRSNILPTTSKITDEEEEIKLVDDIIKLFSVGKDRGEKFVETIKKFSEEKRKRVVESLEEAVIRRKNLVQLISSCDESAVPFVKELLRCHSLFRLLDQNVDTFEFVVSLAFLKKGVEETRKRNESRNVFIKHIEKHFYSIAERTKGLKYLERIKWVLPRSLREEIVALEYERKVKNRIDIEREKTKEERRKRRKEKKEKKREKIKEEDVVDEIETSSMISPPNLLYYSIHSSSLLNLSLPPPSFTVPPLNLTPPPGWGTLPPPLPHLMAMPPPLNGIPQLGSHLGMPLDFSGNLQQFYGGNDGGRSGSSGFGPILPSSMGGYERGRFW